MEPVGSHTTADLLALDSHFWYRQRRHSRSQSAHFFLCHRHRLLAADRRVLHEHHRAHTTRLNAHLGCTRRPIRYQEGFLCPVCDPGSGAGSRHIERRYPSRLRGLLSLRHRLAGSFVLREVIWANFFGRVSLGTVRGLSLFFSHLFAASGAPFFGFLHDRMGSYNLSFIIFSCALFTSSLLILLAKPPRKTRVPIGSPG